MTIEREIIVGYTYNRGAKTYTARAYLRESGFPGLPPDHVYKIFLSCRTCESRITAMQDAIAAVRKDTPCLQDVPVTDKGRVISIFLDGYCF